MPCPSALDADEQQSHHTPNEQHQETSVHVLQIHRVIAHLHQLSDIPAPIAFGQVLLQPALDESHLVHPLDLLVDEVQVRTVLRHHDPDAFVYKIVVSQGEVTSIIFKKRLLHDVLQVALPVNVNVASSPDPLDNIGRNLAHKLAAIQQPFVLLLVRVLHVVLEEAVRTHTPGHVRPAGQLVEIAYGNVDFGESQEGHQITTVRCYQDDDDQPPGAHYNSTTVRQWQVHATLLQKSPVNVPEAIGHFVEASAIKVNSIVVVVRTESVDDVQEGAHKNDARTKA